MTGDGDGGLQTCLEAEQTKTATRDRFESIAALLELVRTSDDDRRDVLVTGAARRALSSPKKAGQRRC